jgi:hypothetical protein
MSLVRVAPAMANPMFNATAGGRVAADPAPVAAIQTKEVRMPTFRSVLLASAMGMLGIQSTVAQQSEGERPSWALEWQDLPYAGHAQPLHRSRRRSRTPAGRRLRRSQILDRRRNRCNGKQLFH